MKLSILIVLVEFFGLVQNKVSIDVNPGCKLPECFGPNPEINLVYIKVQGDVNCLHYLWSFVEALYPTLLMIKSDSNQSSVAIDWEHFVHSSHRSIKGSVKVLCANHSCGNSSQSSVYLLQSIIEYNDTKNNADITDKLNFYVSTYDLSDLHWKFNVSQSDNSVLMQGSTNQPKQMFTNWSHFTLKFMTKNKTGRGLLFPHLPFNNQSSMLEVVFNNFSTAYVGSRFALKVVVANPGNASNSGGEVNGDVTKILKWSIDDEYSPSVFTTQQILWWKQPKSYTSFWLWRTVCYTKPTPTRVYSSDVQTTGLVLANDTTTKKFHNNSLLCAYFGNAIKKLSIKTSIVSFGKPDDGFYVATRYVSWTSLVGAGEPPSDSLSLLVVCIIFTGVGCPVLVILFGAAYLVIRKFRKQRNLHVKLLTNYEPIG